MWRYFFLLSSFCIPAFAFPSLSLDPDFGNGGKVVYQAGAHASARQIIVQPDGKILVFGLAQVSQNAVRIIRLDRDGTVDSDFGLNGEVITPIQSDYLEFWHCGALLPDGRIIVGGNTSADGSVDFALARYHGDGSIDKSFGQNGIASLDFGGSTESINAITVRSDGRIIAAGKTNHNNIEGDFAVAQFSADGILDTSFAVNGKLIYDRNSADAGYAAIIQPDQKILIGGRIGPYCGVLRLNINGSVDTAFGTNGLAVHNSTSIGKNLALQPDGKILSVGDGIVRFDSNGTLDPSFGNGGRATLNDSFLSAIKVRPDGVILVAGNSTFLPATDENFVTASFDEKGILISRTDTDFHGHERAEALFLYPDGSVLSAGFVVVTGGVSDIGLAKYTGPTRLTHKIADLDGDGKTDISVFRNGRWFSINSASNSFNQTFFGTGTDVIAPADFDGDAKADLAVFRDGVWYQLLTSDNSVQKVYFGLNGDIPVAADYDGDGRDDVAVFRQGTWYELRSGDDSFYAEQFGVAADLPVRGDFDGDGKTDLTVYRDGIWYQHLSADGFAGVQFGLAGDVPVAADYDGDRLTDIAVYRDGTWYLNQSTNGFAAAQFGLASDIPVAGDYDGDGKTDLGVFRGGVWYLSQTSSGLAGIQFGLNGDIPLPSK